MHEAEDREEDASAVLRAIQVENEALQRALLGRKTEPPTSPLQVRSGPEGRDHRRLPGDPVVSEQHLKKEMLYRHPELIAALFSCP